MGIIDGFLNQSIQLETLHSIDAYGDPSYNTAVTYPARVERRIKKVLTVGGEDAVSTVQVFLDGLVDVSYNARITLPSTMSPRQPRILAIEDGVGYDGTVEYIEVDT